MQRLLITTLAEYQTTFWVEVGVRLQALGHHPVFLSFDDRSTEMLQARGCPVHSATHHPTPPDDQLDAVFQRFGVDQLNFWLGHERFAFEIGDGLALRRKLATCLEASDLACRDILRDGPAAMVQELGGFLSVIGAYHAARRHGMDNWFLEPSFFRGRLFFLKNSFAALQVPDDHQGELPEAMLRYLDDTVRQGSIVIPQKDRHQYTTAWKKVVNARNAKRLVVKVVDKHVHRKRQEFGHIGSHVRTHARLLVNSRKLQGHYSPLNGNGRFIYYPLHVPGDMALTLRTPHLLDQLALIDYLCRSVPASHVVAVKEHPAMVGAVDADRLLAMLGRYENLKLLPPTTNNYEVLRSADAVVSINSKSGAEAALLGKPVLVLGDAFYGHSPIVRRVDRLQDLPAALQQVLRDGPVGPTEAQVRRYFAAVWRRSLPGELYVPEPGNVATFTDSLVAAIDSPTRP